MSKRASVYLTDRTEAILGVGADGESLSGRINAVVDRYGELITRARRTVLVKFDSAEMDTLLTIALVWDTRKLSAAQSLGALSDEVLELSVTQSLGAGKNLDALRVKLAELSPVEEMALIEWLENGAYRNKNGGVPQ